MNEEPPKTLREKIARRRRKSGGKTRARVKAPGVPSSVAKIMKRAGSIADLFTAADQEENVRVIREAKSATHKVYDTEKKKLVKVPDHKTRLAAVILDLSYSEGKPVERVAHLHGKAEDLAAFIERARQSPEVMRILEILGGAQLGAGFQKSGGEKLVTDAREIPPAEAGS